MTALEDAARQGDGDEIAWGAVPGARRNRSRHDVTLLRGSHRHLRGARTSLSSVPHKRTAIKLRGAPQLGRCRRHLVGASVSNHPIICRRCNQMERPVFL